MHAMLGARAFSLAANRASGGVYCGADGVFIGPIPLLKRGGVAGIWSVRPLGEPNNELSAQYRHPIDIAVKANALALIAHAVNRGDLAMAAIATVQMQLPDPPLAKDAEAQDQIARRAGELRRIGLLKFLWDPLKHPRMGTPPNPGWFAPVEGAVEQTPRAQLAVLPNDAVIPLCLASTGGLGDCLGGVGGLGGEGRGEDSDFVEPRGGTESGEHRAPFQLKLPLSEEPYEPLPAAETPSAREIGPRAAAPRETQPMLQSPDELPPQLKPYKDGEKTFGIFETPDGRKITLQSGYDGPAANLPAESSGFDGITLSHVEGHAAALMRQQGIGEGTLYINNPKICKSCTRLLPTMLPKGATLRIVLPNGAIQEFEGIGP